MDATASEQPPVKKQRIEVAANLSGTGNEDQQEEEEEDKEPGTSSPDLNLPRRRLPLELECEVFQCLKVPTQREFISGLGYGIYGICGPKLRTILRAKRVAHPPSNIWGNAVADSRYSRIGGGAIITPEGLRVYPRTRLEIGVNVYAFQGFPIGQNARINNFAGTIVYYFEVTQLTFSEWGFHVGLSNGTLPYAECVGWSQNTYAIPNGSTFCCLSGQCHDFEWPEDAVRPEWNGRGDVVGCGLLIDPKNRLSIFFTANGILLGRQIPINPVGDHLFPTVRMWDLALEANFGGNPEKPFKYDIETRPGMVFDE